MSIPPVVDRELLVQRLSAISMQPPIMPGDMLGTFMQNNQSVPAAVLVPLVQRPQGYSVLLTQRADHLHHHAGQISFPGGRTEASDNSPEETALRETHEEIGLAHQHIELIGRMANYHTITGFVVTPVVGIVVPPFELKADPFEVADIFEVPLEFLVNPDNHELHTFQRDGQQTQYYAMTFNQRFIWGATAGILVNMSRLLLR